MKALRRFAISLVALCLLGGLTGASAQSRDSWDRHVSVINDSSYVIRELYASNVDERDWQEDLLGNRVLLPGHTIRINIDDGTRHCHYDLKAVVQGGGDLFRWNVDVCAVETWTISD